jgi:hypothetical protein
MVYSAQKRGGGWAPRLKDNSGSGQKHSQPTEEHPLGQYLFTIKPDDLCSHGRTDRVAASIDSCEYMASYSWVDAKSPTIMIPGMAALLEQIFLTLTHLSAREASVVDTTKATATKTRFWGLLS